MFKAKTRAALKRTVATPSDDKQDLDLLLPREQQENQLQQDLPGKSTETMFKAKTRAALKRTVATPSDDKQDLDLLLPREQQENQLQQDLPGKSTKTAAMLRGVEKHKEQRKPYENLLRSSESWLEWTPIP
ncbi:hypothetical protein H920_13492 [Fukomys damarensis]|uniref:Uncharacterized protein n=1 Tax=Fukomys damarensis TaxID=885580 RepID=A0A091CZ68_FUKDA|nr:hypothetical protein H920_13492 [Fukomys damarensis]